MLGCIFGPNNFEKGVKFDELLKTREWQIKGSLKCVKACKPKLLTKIRTD